MANQGAATGDLAEVKGKIEAVETNIGRLEELNAAATGDEKLEYLKRLTALQQEKTALQQKENLLLQRRDTGGAQAADQTADIASAVKQGVKEALGEISAAPRKSSSAMSEDSARASAMSVDSAGSVDSASAMLVSEEPSDSDTLMKKDESPPSK